jgi:hypothetical protein
VQHGAKSLFKKTTKQFFQKKSYSRTCFEFQLKIHAFFSPNSSRLSVGWDLVCFEVIRYVFDRNSG